MLALGVLRLIEVVLREVLAMQLMRVLVHASLAWIIEVAVVASDLRAILLVLLLAAQFVELLEKQLGVQASLATSLLEHVALVLRLLKAFLMLRLLDSVLLESWIGLVLEGRVQSLHELHLVHVHVHAGWRVCSELDVALGRH